MLINVLDLLRTSHITATIKANTDIDLEQRHERILLHILQ